MRYGIERLLLTGLVVILLGGQAVAGAVDPAVVLDETCYWRRYCQFAASRYSPAALKSEGKQVLGAKGMARTKRQIERALRAKRINPSRVDWRDHAYQELLGARGFNPLPTPMPSDNWISVAFDDSRWVFRRGPFQGGDPIRITSPNLGQYGGAVDLRLKAAFYRARFVVDDPAKAGVLMLRVTYSGGVRAFLNGTELGRSHLPAGPLGPDTPAADYPVVAYKAGGQRLRDRVFRAKPIPARMLRKGINVLAIEVRASDFHPVVLTNPIQPNWGGPSRPWPHARLSKVELRCGSRGIAPVWKRPRGVQVWVRDMHHRTESDEFLPASEPLGVVRIVGGAGGTYAAQVVVGTDKPLTGLKVTPGELRQVGGSGRLGPSQLRVLHMVPYPLSRWTLEHLGDERGLGASFPDARTLSSYAKMRTARPVCLFDQLVDTFSGTIPADTCRPVWLSFRIPTDAAPGSYRGTLGVSADGVASVSVPVELEVVAWRLPEPKSFRTFVGCEQNPYGVARQYGVKPWSAEHFRLLAGSFRHLGRIGSRWLNVPVLTRTEFGNEDDSMIRRVRKPGGSWSFDYTILDKYLDLAIKHCGKPRVIQFVVMHGMPMSSPPQVREYHGGPGGRSSALTVGGPGVSEQRKRAIWRPFATSLVAHMKARGLDKVMYWGYPLEREVDPKLKFLLAACAPGVGWTAGPHEMMANGTYAKNERFYKVVTDIRYHGRWPSFRDDQGWKSKTLHLLNPRAGGTAIALHTVSLPFAYRLLPDRALAMGRSGFTRVGVDEWAGVHYRGMAIPKWLTGIPVLFTLWPGRSGAESSARFEAMLEGIQEAEARIFIEQGIDRGSVRQDLARRARGVLSQNFRETTFVQGNSLIRAIEEYHYRWQERSRRVYRLAAEVAEQQRK